MEEMNKTLEQPVETKVELSKEEKEKQEKKKDVMLELMIVIMLGITALFTAWASWIGSLHGGNQATNYATSNNLASEGNSEYNAGVQSMMQDMMLWSEISDLQIDILFAMNSDDAAILEQACNKMFYKLNDNLSEDMAYYIGWDFDYQSEDPTEIVLAWMDKEEALVSPFTNEDFANSYFVTASELLTESALKLEEGQQDNKNGDAFGLVTVIYSVVLFLLGITGSFDDRKNKMGLIAISVVSFLIATIYMLTLPMPTGFALLGFFVS